MILLESNVDIDLKERSLQQFAFCNAILYDIVKG